MYRIDLACLKEIARVSNLLNHQNQQRKNDDVKLTNVREDQPVFYITQVESEWQRRIFLFGSRWKTTIDRRSSRFYVFRKLFAQGKSSHSSIKAAAGWVEFSGSTSNPAVSRLIQAKIPIPIIAQLVGWSPSTMWQMAERYGHFSQDELRKAVETISERSSPESPVSTHRTS
jgi:hypothetical protein